MSRRELELEARLAEAQSTIAALVSGEIDAVLDREGQTPVLVAAAQTALRDSEEQYRLIVESTNDGIMKVDAGAVILFVNSRLGQMLGYPSPELVGKSVLDFVAPDSRATAREGLAEQKEVHASRDINFRHRDGSEIPVNLTGVRLFDAAGAYLGSLGIVRDMTEQNRLSSQLMISDRMASVGLLAAGVVHEINNPLAFVTANLSYVVEELGQMPPPRQENESLVASVKDALKEAIIGAERVRGIVRDLKMFSRSDDVERGAVDVAPLLDSTLNMASNEIRHRARLVKVYAPQPLQVEGNESRLAQVFLNLIVNAAQAIPVGSANANEIRVVSRAGADGRVVIEVIDTGEGMSPAVLQRLFTPFFTTKPKGVGTGLGLSLCQKIIAAHGGEIEVESTVGRGTTFRVLLPAATGQPIKGAPVGAPVEFGPRGRVLIVDDEPMVGKALMRLLAPGHEVMAVTSAGEALRRIAEDSRFDVVLCDLMMPDMTGEDFYAELNRTAPSLVERIVFVSGGAFTDTAQRFLNRISNLRIDKPFGAEQVRAIVAHFVALR